MLHMLMALQLSVLTVQAPVRSVKTSEWELGAQIAFNVPGQIVALKFYKMYGDPGPHIGHVWSLTGTKLVEVLFTNETDSGWQSQALPVPFSVSIGAVMVVSVSSPAGANYAMNAGGFTNTITNMGLSIPASGGMYGAPGAFPSSSTPTNYFRDVDYRVDDNAFGTVTLSLTADDSLPVALYATMKGFKPGTYNVTVTIKDPYGVTATSSSSVVFP